VDRAGAGHLTRVERHRPVGRQRVDGDVRTSGGIGQSLVKGHVVPLPAYAVSIQHGGDVGELSIGGSLIAEGDDVITLQAQAGSATSTSAAASPPPGPAPDRWRSMAERPI
jgi:hypothetical protein